MYKLLRNLKLFLVECLIDNLNERIVAVFILKFAKTIYNKLEVSL